MAVLILSPGSLTEPVALRELGIFAAALLVMVLANLVVTRRARRAARGARAA